MFKKIFFISAVAFSALNIPVRSAADDATTQDSQQPDFSMHDYFAARKALTEAEENLKTLGYVPGITQVYTIATKRADVPLCFVGGGRAYLAPEVLDKIAAGQVLTDVEQEAQRVCNEYKKRYTELGALGAHYATHIKWAKRSLVQVFPEYCTEQSFSVGSGGIPVPYTDETQELHKVEWSLVPSAFDIFQHTGTTNVWTVKPEIVGSERAEAERFIARWNLLEVADDPNVEQLFTTEGIALIQAMINGQDPVIYEGGNAQELEKLSYNACFKHASLQQSPVDALAGLQRETGKLRAYAEKHKKHFACDNLAFDDSAPEDLVLASDYDIQQLGKPYFNDAITEKIQRGEQLDPEEAHVVAEYTQLLEENRFEEIRTAAAHSKKCFNDAQASRLAVDKALEALAKKYPEFYTDIGGGRLIRPLTIFEVNHGIYSVRSDSTHAQDPEAHFFATCYTALILYKTNFTETRQRHLTSQGLQFLERLCTGKDPVVYGTDQAPQRAPEAIFTPDVLQFIPGFDAQGHRVEAPSQATTETSEPASQDAPLHVSIETVPQEPSLTPESPSLEDTLESSASTQSHTPDESPELLLQNEQGSSALGSPSSPTLRSPERSEILLQPEDFIQEEDDDFDDDLRAVIRASLQEQSTGSLFPDDAPSSSSSSEPSSSVVQPTQQTSAKTYLAGGVGFVGASVAICGLKLQYDAARQALCAEKSRRANATVEPSVSEVWKRVARNIKCQPPSRQKLLFGGVALTLLGGMSALAVRN